MDTDEINEIIHISRNKFKELQEKAAKWDAAQDLHLPHGTIIEWKEKAKILDEITVNGQIFLCNCHGNPAHISATSWRLLEEKSKKYDEIVKIVYSAPYTRSAS